jgi:hypothetical protein
VESDRILVVGFLLIVLVFMVIAILTLAGVISAPMVDPHEWPP